MPRPMQGNPLATEKHRLRHIAQRFRVPISCVYDCGSRDALDGLQLADMFSARQLHVFECNPDAVTLCRENLKRSARADLDWKLNEVALGEIEGTIPFFAIDPKLTRTVLPDGNIGASSTLVASPKYSKERYVQKEIQVSAITLGKYFNGNDVPDLLWMDLQGAELKALKGAGPRLAEIKLIHIEVSFRRMYIGQPLFWELDAFLKGTFQLEHVDLGRWPRCLPLYRMFNTGPWVANAIYVNRRYT